MLLSAVIGGACLLFFLCIVACILWQKAEIEGRVKR